MKEYLSVKLLTQTVIKIPGKSIQNMIEISLFAYFAKSMQGILEMTVFNILLITIRQL